jgi:hypothetical protein
MPAFAIFIGTLISGLLQKVFTVLSKFFKKVVISVALIAFIISLEFLILQQAFKLVEPLVISFPYLNYLVYFGIIQGLQNYILILVTVYSGKKALELTTRFI